MSIQLMTPSNYLILCRILLLLPSIFPSIRIFSNKSALHIRWPKYWSFSFSISPSNQYSRLFSLGLTGLIYLQSKGLSGVFSNTTVQSISSSMLSLLYGPTLISVHDQFMKRLQLYKYYILSYLCKLHERWPLMNSGYLKVKEFQHIPSSVGICCFLLITQSYMETCVPQATLVFIFSSVK